MVYMEGTADIVVRSVDEELVRRVRADAALRGESFKMWVEEACALRLGVKIGVKVKEGQDVDDVVRGVRRDNRGGGRGSDVESIRSARSGKPPSESGAVVGGIRADSGRKGKGEEGQRCPKCGEELREWGNQMNCKSCGQNFPKESK